VRIFTPDWYARTQAEDAPADVWQRAFDRYHAHRNRIDHRMTPPLRRFSNLQFHDCRISEVLMRPNCQVRIALKGFRRNRAGKRPVEGIHQIMLQNVTATNLNPWHVGDWWLYEEVDVARRGYRLSALLDGRSILWFEFQTLLFKTVR
jgi:hypothetical protein